VGLRSYGQKDPLVEYKGEAFTYFEELMDNIRLQVCTSLFRSATNLVALENIKAMLARNARTEGPNTEPAPGGRPAASRPGPGPGGREVKLPNIPVKREFPKVGRNEPCPCGSGKKYKQCHGA
jgi:preprotein translocase subunit SecA